MAMDPSIPCYDSPIESEFAYHLSKYISEDALLIPQYQIQTLCGLFIIDFVIKKNQTLIAIECDGRDYHNTYRDEWRDAMILGDSEIACIWRISGADISYRINEVLYIISSLYPDAFSERGLINLETLAPYEIKSRDINFDTSNLRFSHYDDYEDQHYESLIRHRHKNIPEGRRQFWQAAYLFACSNKGLSLDDVIARYQRRNV